MDINQLVCAEDSTLPSDSLQSIPSPSLPLPSIISSSDTSHPHGFASQFPPSYLSSFVPLQRSTHHSKLFQDRHPHSQDSSLASTISLLPSPPSHHIYRDHHISYAQQRFLQTQHFHHQQSQSQQRVECGLCGKSFSGISSHNRHVSRTHHKARPFSCADCGLQFGQKGSLDRHTAAVHLKARPFSCDFCGKGFGRKDNMKIHMTTVHLKKKPFKCDMCPKSFGGKRPLKIHRQTVHFKERPLQCPYCDKRFGQRSNLNVHIKVHKRSPGNLPPIISPPQSPIPSTEEGIQV